MEGMTMRRLGRGTLGALLGVGLMLAALSSASAAVEKSGPEAFHGGLVISGATGGRKVVGSVIAASGVYNGVGRIVERPNRAGDSDNQSRDDLVFAQGSFHLLTTNHRFSVKVNRKTCVITFNVRQTATIDGGTRRFAGATGSFVGSTTGSGTARRKPNGSCDQQRGPIDELDIVSGTGMLTY
jgi:hypothetical protein